MLTGKKIASKTKLKRNTLIGKANLKHANNQEKFNWKQDS